jgi:acyl carrier protein
MKPDETEIQQKIITILKELTTDWDWEDLEMESSDIGPQTTLSHDLGFSSVDALDLLSSIDLHFGRKFPYEYLILQNGAYVYDLSVAQIAYFVQEHFDVPDPGPRAM